MLILPGILAIFFSNMLTKRQEKILILIFASYLLIPIVVTGDRRYSVIMLIVVFLSYLKKNKIKLNLKVLLPIIYLGIILLNFLIVIRNQRLIGFNGILSFIQLNFKDIFFGTDFIIETLSEFGLSFFSVVNVFTYIPNHIPFYHGFTFLAMVPTLLPIGWAFPNFFAKASLSNVINARIGYPVGATLLGDLYGNFGYFGGIIGSAIAYYLILKCVDIHKKSIGLKNVIYFSTFFIFLNLIRATPFEMFRPLFLYVILITSIYSIFSTRGRKLSNGKEKSNISNTLS